MPTAPVESLANSKDVSSQDEALLPAIERMTELRDNKVTCAMITGDFIRRGIAPLKRRPQPLWEARLKMGTLVPSKPLGMKMAFLILGVPYCLPSGVHSLLDRPEGGDVVPPMP